MTISYSDVRYTVDNWLCLSCGACAAACVKDSISFKETIGGYLFPIIDLFTCINCGLCLKVCPGVRYHESIYDGYLTSSHLDTIKAGYVGKSLDERIYQNAQSGGVVTAILKHLLDTREVDGVLVATMSRSSPPRGEAVLIKSSNDLAPAQKSKYVPIPLLANLRNYLKSVHKIAVVGLPCHLHGLENLIEIFPEITGKISLKIGLICDRVLTNASIGYFSHKATDKEVCHIIS